MPLLTLIVFTPLIGAILVALVPVREVRVLRGVSFGITLLTALFGFLVWQDFDPNQAALQLTESRPWFELPGALAVNYSLGIDGISILLVSLTAFLMPLVLVSASQSITTRVREFLVWLLIMEAGMLGVFLATDIFLFYVFWEVSLVPLYFMLGIWGGERRLYATLKFFLFTLAGSLVMLVGVIALVYLSGTMDIAALTQWAGTQPLEVQGWLFAAFALAFAIKVPLLPFHTWLPDAHTEAPTAGSVILAGVLLKMGTYGLLRFGIAMFPLAALEASTLFMILGALGIIYGAFLAMAQTDVKRLIACSSVSHLGFVVLGMFALTGAGLRGSVLQMVNHGLSTGLLFLLIGMIYERRHSRELADYGGIAKVMPLFAFFFVFSVLSSVGLPGLNGFVGEWLILLGAFEASPVLTAVSVTGVIFGAVYLLRATRLMLFGEITHTENKTLSDLTPRELGVLTPICLLCLVIGVMPGPFIQRTEASLAVIEQRLDAARDQQAAGVELDLPDDQEAESAR
jgi:NADH-quinone oxidoreductase subunit M